MPGAACSPRGDSDSTAAGLCVEMEPSCLGWVTDDRAPAMASPGPRAAASKLPGETGSGRGAGMPRAQELGQGEL